MHASHRMIPILALVLTVGCGGPSPTASDDPAPTGTASSAGGAPSQGGGTNVAGQAGTIATAGHAGVTSAGGAAGATSKGGAAGANAGSGGKAGGAAGASGKAGGGAAGTNGGKAGAPSNGGSSGAGGGAAGSGGSAAPAKYAHVSGSKLVDGDGKPLLLRGVSLGNWMLNEGYMWKFDGPNGDRGRRMEQRVEELIGADKAKAFWKAWRAAFVTEADITRIHDLGFNSIRLPLNARLLMPDGQDSFDEEGFAYVHDVVAWCKKAGLWVILDMHGAPGGQTGTNIDDDANDHPDLFASGKGNVDRLVKLWKELATRYSNEPAVLGYDLLNEPIAPDFSSMNDQLWPTYQKVGAAIRTVDTHHALIVEGAQWANNWSTLDAPFDDNFIYSFHKYWDATDTASIQGYLDHRNQWKKPLWVGETGENDDGWYQAVIPMLEKNDVGWAFWTWKKMDSGNNPYSVPPPSDWWKIQNYVSDPSQKPSPAEAQAVLDQLVTNVALSHCTYNEHVVCSLVHCN